MCFIFFPTTLLLLLSKVFPPSLSKRSDGTPFLGASMKDDWISDEALTLFWTYIPKGEEMCPFDHDVKAWAMQLADTLAEYLRFLLPNTSPLSQNAFFDLENAAEWILDGPFTVWLNARNSRRQVKKENLELSIPVKLGKRKTRKPAVIEISSDEEEHDPVPNLSKSIAKSGLHETKKIKRESSLLTSTTFINLTSDDNESSQASEREQSPIKCKKKGQNHILAKEASGHEPITQLTGVRITQQQWVQHLKMVYDIPPEWDVSRELTGYILDLTDNRKYDLEKEGIIHWIHHENQSSWGGNTGHEKGDTYVKAGLLGKDNVRCRRAEFSCNGIKSYGFEGWEVDEDEMRPFWLGELDSNEEEASNSNSILARFYLHANEMKCKVECNGKAVLHKVPKSLDVVELFENGGKMKGSKESEEVNLHGSCTVVVLPRSHQTKCRLRLTK
ncbi:hypothetical protein CPB84DRAFT_1749649 [Gymnopilus junonius]|uniref:Uncharacterized protein n=1 Tax=Gymnopilus junonius TaxID=109634 RepID=A0A9P5NIU2_GYMJU|nr:hypothetical protein CPB84DRAFT_1749649 [Gymnopilus junonius]